MERETAEAVAEWINRHADGLHAQVDAYDDALDDGAAVCGLVVTRDDGEEAFYIHDAEMPERRDAGPKQKG